MNIPVVTSSTRPLPAAAGAIRMNTTTNTVEMFNGADWVIVDHNTVLGPQWKEWFAWRPVKIHKKWKWMRKVYRRAIPKGYVNHDDWQRYEYGTVFDAIRDNR